MITFLFPVGQLLGNLCWVKLQKLWRASFTHLGRVAMAEVLVSDTPSQAEFPFMLEDGTGGVLSPTLKPLWKIRELFRSSECWWKLLKAWQCRQWQDTGAPKKGKKFGTSGDKVSEFFTLEVWFGFTSTLKPAAPGNQHSTFQFVRYVSKIFQFRSFSSFAPFTLQESLFINLSLYPNLLA